MIENILLFDVPQWVEINPSNSQIKSKLIGFDSDYSDRFKHLLPFSDNDEFREYVANYVGFEKVTSNGRFITRLEKAVSKYASVYSTENPVKHPDWIRFKSKVAQRLEIATRKIKVCVKFVRGYENIAKIIEINECSCFNTSYAHSVDTIVENDGFAMVSCYESGNIDYECRAWIIPQFNEEKQITAFALFNGYGWDKNIPTTKAAEIFSEIISCPANHETMFDFPGVYNNGSEYFEFNLFDTFYTSKVKRVYDGKHNLLRNGYCYVCEMCGKHVRTLNRDMYFICDDCLNTSSFCYYCRKFHKNSEYNILGECFVYEKDSLNNIIIPYNTYEDNFLSSQGM
jgi:hypothetical protein